MAASHTASDFKTSQHSVDANYSSTASNAVLPESSNEVTEKSTDYKHNKRLLVNLIRSKLRSSEALLQLPNELFNIIEAYAYDPFYLLRRLLDRYGEPLTKASAFMSTQSSAFNSVHNRDELFEAAISSQFTGELSYEMFSNLCILRPVKFVRLLIEYILQYGEVSDYSIPLVNHMQQTEPYQDAAWRLKGEIINVLNHFDLADELHEAIQVARRNKHNKVDLMTTTCLLDARPIFFRHNGKVKRGRFHESIVNYICPSSRIFYEIMMSYGISLACNVKNFQVPILFPLAHLSNEWRRGYYEMDFDENVITAPTKRVLDTLTDIIDFSDWFIIGLPVLFQIAPQRNQDAFQELFIMMVMGSFLLSGLTLHLRSISRSTTAYIKRYLECALSSNEKAASTALQLISFASFNLRSYHFLDQLSLPYSPKYLFGVLSLSHLHHMELGSLQLIHEFNQRNVRTPFSPQNFGWQMLSIVMTVALPLLLSLGFGADESLLWQVLAGFTGSIELMVEFANVRAVRKACDGLELPLKPAFPSIRLSTHRNALHNSRSSIELAGEEKIGIEPKAMSVKPK